MIRKIKSILFVVCIVMVFTAQTKRPDDKSQPHAPVNRTAPVAHNNQPRPQAQMHKEVPHSNQAKLQVQARRVAAPQQLVQRRASPPVQSHPMQPSHQERNMPRVYAVPTPAPATNNRLFHRHHHNNWQPLYNFYNNQYQFYPYVNVASPVELSADYVTVLFNGQTYFYDQGSFYVQDPQGYLAVPPPLGIIVSMIPPQARQINVNGQITMEDRKI